MKIAFFSYEYFHDTAYSGIATYTHQTADSLARLGEHVEVFVASCSPRDSYINEAGVYVNPILCKSEPDFRKKVVAIFSNREAQVNFDILESPEYQAPALLVVQAFPHLPLVVRFHTPGFFLAQMENEYYHYSFLTQGKQKLKQLLGRNSYFKYIKEDDIEYQISKLATFCVSPSTDLAQIIKKYWSIKTDQILPNSYNPSPAYLDIPIVSNHKTITYIGKLQYWKGVFILAESIKEILDIRPDWQWRLIGRSLPSYNYKDTIKNELKAIFNADPRVEFLDMVPNDKLPHYLAQTDISVIPSYFDNYPLVCLEAMAAGRGIVATNYGGMREMLQGKDFQAGLLVPPRNSKALTASLLALIDDSTLRHQLGGRARNRIKNYSSQKVIKETLQLYTQIIKKSKK